MTHIKSPYNFVPLNEQVVTPEWADFISHDVPFRDAQSGELTITIEAKSPMFVRNGAPKSQEKVTDFSNIDGQHFLPGTSLKGMTRNVLEILTFSKMGNKVNDHRYAIRDLSGSVKEQYLGYFKPDSIFCGWLYKSGDTYCIEDCGIPGRVKHRHLDGVFSTDFAQFYTEDGGFKGNNDEHKSAKFKYEQRFKSHNRLVNVRPVGEDAGRKIYEIDQDSEEKKGTIVFTGQPGPRKQGNNGKWTGHHLEFVFLEQVRPKTLKVDLKIMDNFFFAYLEHDKPRWSVDWKFWREKLFRNEKIPVFFHRKNDEVTALGLSYLFKLPFKKSVVEAMGYNHSGNITDFSEALFGYISNNDEFQALKGRIQFGHAFAKGPVQVDSEKKEVLSSPKASYYPNYIRQDVKQNGTVNRYNTYMDDGAKIAGWKRYPVHRGNTKLNNPAPANTSQEILTTFTPIKAGAVFTGAIRYHNLHPIELGALLSSLTFHGSPTAFHSLGMAKPLGYGKVTVTVEGLDNQAHYMGLFEAYMTQKVTSWLNSAQVKELLTMATEQERNEGNAQLTYMKLDQLGRQNDFSSAKSAKEALDVYSKLNGIQSAKLGSKASPAHQQAVVSMTAEFKALNQHGQQLKSAKNEHRKRFEEALERQKKSWLEQLQKQKDAAEQQVAQLRKAKVSEQAKQSGPAWNTIKWDNRNNAFEDLQKLIRQYCTKYHADNNYDRLVKNHPEGVLPEEYRAELLERLTGVFNLQIPRDQDKWRGENSQVMRKVKEWAGETAAQVIQKQWSN